MTNNPAFARVADVYRQAALAGRGPAKAVSETLGIPLPTANAWIRRTKDLGLLEENFRVVHRNARAVRVADALGIDYDTLVAAVLEHADGDLRVQPPPAAIC